MPTLEQRSAVWFRSASIPQHKERILDDVYDVDFGLVTRMQIAGVIGDRAELCINSRVFTGGANVLVCVDDEDDFTDTYRCPERLDRQPWRVTRRDWRFGDARQLHVYVEAIPVNGYELMTKTWFLIVELLALDKDVYADIGETWELPKVDLSDPGSIPNEWRSGYPESECEPFSRLCHPIQTAGQMWRDPQSELDQIVERLQMMQLRPINLPRPRSPPLPSVPDKREQPSLPPSKATAKKAKATGSQSQALRRTDPRARELSSGDEYMPVQNNRRVRENAKILEKHRNVIREQHRKRGLRSWYSSTEGRLASLRELMKRIDLRSPEETLDPIPHALPERWPSIFGLYGIGFQILSGPSDQ